MHQVMIVDDEALVRIGLQSIIDWEKHGFQLSGVFKNAQEALEAASQQHYDVILTDINMPGMDGFALIRALKQQGSTAEFVILSSYHDFEYTRQAIQLGVKDYISKYALEPDELIRVLGALNLPLAAKADRPATTSGQLLLDTLLHHKQTNEPDAQVPQLHLLLADEHLMFCWIIISPLSDERVYRVQERKALQLLIEETLRRLKSLIYLGNDEGHSHGLAAFPSSEEDWLPRLRDMLDSLVQAGRQNLNVELVVGISSLIMRDTVTVKKLEQIRDEATQLQHLAFYEGSGVYDQSRQAAYHPSEQEWLDIYRASRKSIQLEQFEQVLADIEQLQANGKARWHPQAWERLGNMLVSHLTDLTIDRFPPESDRMKSYVQQLAQFAAELQQTHRFELYLEQLREMFKQYRQWLDGFKNKEDWLEQVKAYVEGNLHQTIRLEDAASLAHFNVNYFSQRFRKNVGEGFNDYVTRRRIETAIELLRESKLTTDEIASRVGYANANYFIKVFKKVTGKTISAFKQKY